MSNRIIDDKVDVIVYDSFMLLVDGVVFVFNDTATTEIYTYRHTRSLHDALPIFAPSSSGLGKVTVGKSGCGSACSGTATRRRSEEHTSELQSLMRISYAVFCLKKIQKRRQSLETKYKRTTAS